jgi:DNA-binding MarR family transcriptional regulator
MHHLAQLLTSEADQILLERFGIGFSQFKILLCLEQHAGIPQNKIASDLNQTEASISRQISIMQKKGMIILKSGKDVRQNLVYPTNLGIEIIAKGSRALENYSEPIFEDFNSKQKKNFDEILKNLNQFFEN